MKKLFCLLAALALLAQPLRAADLLKYYAEIQNVFKEFEVQEAMPTTQQLKDAFNLRMKDEIGRASCRERV